MVEDSEIHEMLEKLLSETKGEADREFIKIILPNISDREFSIIYRLGRIRGQQKILEELGA